MSEGDLINMSEGDLVNLGFDRHLVQCPHCKKQVVHKWPGNMILFATAKCTHCDKEFVITLNEPRS
jgi:transposase-like protein